MRNIHFKRYFGVIKANPFFLKKKVEAISYKKYKAKLVVLFKHP